MKTKITIAVLVTAIVTLSFTFATGIKRQQTKAVETKSVAVEEPVGGFSSDDKL